MDWAEAFALVGVNVAPLGNIGMILLSRSDSKSDLRRLEADFNAQLAGIRKEVGDSHGRSSAVEDRNRGK